MSGHPISWRIAIDLCFGETRTAVLDDAGLAHLYYQRDTAQIADGDIFLGRVTAAPAGLDGAFLSLGPGLDAFLPLRRSKTKPVVGRLIPVRVRIAARQGKQITVSRDLDGVPGRLIEDAQTSEGGPRRIFRDPDRWMAPVKARAADETLVEVVVTDPALLSPLQTWCRTEAPHLLDRLHLDRADPPLFERLGIEEEIGRLFSARLPLPKTSGGGGSITIEDTAAGTVIDVDTGEASGPDMEKVATDVNREAARLIARQLRLRRVGGLVLIDFVTLRTVRARKQVLATLDAALEGEGRWQRTDFSPFGVVELNGPRETSSLMDEIGRRGAPPGMTAATNAHAILRRLLRESRANPADTLGIKCDPETARWLEETTMDGVSMIEQARQALHTFITVEPSGSPGVGETGWSVYTRPRT